MVLADAAVSLGGVIALIPILIVAGIVVAAQHMVICGPDEVLVLTGRRHQRPDGQFAGYRVVKGGRTFRYPFLESCERLAIQLPPVEVEGSFFTKGGTQTQAHALAKARIDPREPQLYNAIERFLGIPPEEIASIAGEVLQGHLAGLLAVTASPVDPMTLEDRLLEESREDFATLGLELERVTVNLK